jgi:hypothetical protein
MGRTYHKEKSFDERKSNKGKRSVAAEQERKFNKNHRFIDDVTYEDESDIEEEDEFQSDQP